MSELIVGSVIALVAAFGGAAFAAWLSFQQAMLLEQQRANEEGRRRALEVKAAARLVSTDLGMTAVQADAAIANKTLAGLRAAPTTAWATYGALLVVELPFETQEIVAQAMVRTTAVAELVAGAQLGLPGIEDNAEALESVKTLSRMCRAAQEALAPVGYPELASSRASGS